MAHLISPRGCFSFVQTSSHSFARCQGNWFAWHLLTALFGRLVGRVFQKLTAGPLKSIHFLLKWNMLSLEFQFFASILLGRYKITTMKGFDFFLFISVKFHGSIFCPYNDDSEFTTHGHKQTRQFLVTSAKVTPKGSLVRESYHVSSGHFGRLMCTTPT